MKLFKASVFSFIALLSISIFFSCRQAPEVKGFDKAKWLSDPDGCRGLRAEVWSAFEPNKNNLMGYSENHLKQLLGMPASKDLFEKGQKIYTYTISGSAKCKNSILPSRQLQLRLNATGKVSEVLLIRQ